MKNILVYSLMAILLSDCAAQKNLSASSINLPGTNAIAFPGAEGFGKYTTGGRGGKVFIVSRLNDKGPGSFREAAESKEKRIIVFNEAGTIHLSNTKLVIQGTSIMGLELSGAGRIYQRTIIYLHIAITGTRGSME